MADINTFLKPQLTVIDGFVAMEDRDPTDDQSVKRNLILAETYTVATGATCVRIMDIDPH
ncbi:MAG: DUF362 domain-containing protein [Candidatus Bathyarchaeia archaeon]